MANTTNTLSNISSSKCECLYFCNICRKNTANRNKMSFLQRNCSVFSLRLGTEDCGLITASHSLSLPSHTWPQGRPPLVRDPGLKKGPRPQKGLLTHIKPKILINQQNPVALWLELVPANKSKSTQHWIFQFERFKW